MRVHAAWRDASAPIRGGLRGGFSPLICTIHLLISTATRYRHELLKVLTHKQLNTYQIQVTLVRLRSSRKLFHTPFDHGVDAYEFR